MTHADRPLRYQRVGLKLSGEALCGKEGGYGIDTHTMKATSQELAEVHKTGVQIGIVVGGGNIIRGMAAAAQGIDRVAGDHMGLLATVINGLALQEALEKRHISNRLMSAVEVRHIAEPFIRRRAMRHLEKGRVVVFAGGTGNPFFTTDSAAALRAVEIGAELLLKATKVDGVYDTDPKKNHDAQRFEQLNYDEVIARDLKVMDTAAIALCRDYDIPLRIYDISQEGGLMRILRGESIGTLVHGRA